MALKTELFLDDHLIEVTLGVTRRIQPPQKHRLNPVMRSEHWWQGNCIMPLATLYDAEEKLFRMWYRTGPVDQTDEAIDGHVSYTAYAESTSERWWPDRERVDLPDLSAHDVEYSRTPMYL